MSERIKKIFETKGKKLVTFTTGGDPDLNTSLEILKTIINNGIDIIEIGMPFSDPMADGPTIQESSVRSLANGTKINDIFEIYWMDNVKSSRINSSKFIKPFYSKNIHRSQEKIYQYYLNKIEKS